MKLEKLERNKRKKIVIGVVVFLCFISALIYTGSQAKYKVTQSIPLVNGTINYEIGDFNTVAMYQVNGSGDYTEITKMPESGYAINEEKSYCKVNGEKDLNARLYTNENSEHVIANLQKNSKCYVWFDVKAMTIPEMIASHNPTVGQTSFTGVSTTDEGLLSGTDDDGTTYYFRGNVTNNWVQFAGFYWRIIRINGDGSIRIIYNGTSTKSTGEGTQIGTSAYNINYEDNVYVGYMYGTAGSSTYAATHENVNNSAIKTVVDNWYETNVIDAGYSSKVSSDAGFCNDRSVASSNQIWWSYSTNKGFGKNATAYGPWSRILKTDGNWNSTQTPKFTCTNASSDFFTVSTSAKGNKKLTYPVGLITSDEIVFGGGFGGTDNSSYYLYTNKVYWTMSPSNVYSNGYVKVFYEYSDGYLGSNTADSALGVRPVINLSSDVKLTGSGTASDPYKVV